MSRLNGSGNANGQRRAANRFKKAANTVNRRNGRRKSERAVDVTPISPEEGAAGGAEEVCRLTMANRSHAVRGHDRQATWRLFQLAGHRQGHAGASQLKDLDINLGSLFRENENAATLVSPTVGPRPPSDGSWPATTESWHRLQAAFHSRDRRFQGWLATSTGRFLCATLGSGITQLFHERCC